jgi:hypothetical protein
MRKEERAMRKEESDEGGRRIREGVGMASAMMWIWHHQICGCRRRLSVSLHYRL